MTIFQRRVDGAKRNPPTRILVTDIVQWWSLKTRLTLFTLAIFLISIWSLVFYVSSALREDMQRLLGEQQYSTVSLIAGAVNRELDERLRALETYAARISPAMLGDRAAVQAFLEDRPLLQGLFNAGVIAVDLDGTAIADVPLSTGRTGVNYIGNVHIAGALREGKTTLGRPFMGKTVKAPIVAMATPIRDAQGKVIGALSGVIELGKPNFLDQITESRYREGGGYLLLVAPQYRLIVTASDKSRIMEALPAPSINSPPGRFIPNNDGTAIFINQHGVELLSSHKGIPAADWYVAAALPTAIAFAPIRDMQQRLLLATIFFTLLVGGLTWWMLRRQLAPMFAAARTLAALADTNQPPQPLPITRPDEIGQLIGGFNRLLDMLNHASRVKSEFMANVTHELRTPLNSVIGFAELLKDEVPGPLNAKQAAFAADILASGERLLALVEGILEMSRLDGAGAGIERGPVEIGAAIEERAAAQRKVAEARGVTIGLEVALDAGSAELDPQALRRMLDALLDNAVKFNREGGTVTVSARRANGALEIAVADTGIGIAQEDLAKLFKPLVQLDAGLARRYGGVGMGLALARRLAELHGGTIDVKSEPGKGSTFTLRLPIKEKS